MSILSRLGSNIASLLGYRKEEDCSSVVEEPSWRGMLNDEPVGLLLEVSSFPFSFSKLGSQHDGPLISSWSDISPSLLFIVRCRFDEAALTTLTDLRDEDNY